MDLTDFMELRDFTEALDGDGEALVVKAPKTGVPVAIEDGAGLMV